MFCGECQHWRQGCLELRYGRDLGSCNCSKFILAYGNQDVPVDGVQVESDEGWGFFSGRFFGCIHFVKKEVGVKCF